MLLPLLLVVLTATDAGEGERVRLQAAVVVASTQGRDVAKVLQPLQRRLRTLLPYTSYKGFTEYTASVEPGESIELRLPDGRLAHLTPKGAEATAEAPPSAGHGIHVAIDQGEQFDSQTACGAATIFQVRNGTADHAGDRTFLVFEETCPGKPPTRLLK